MRSLMLVALVTLAGCLAPSGVWGPLAVIDEKDELFAAALGGAGELRIDEECVTLMRTDVAREITLVWRNSQTSWIATDSRVRFNDKLSGKSLDLMNGDHIEVGGAGQSSSTWIAEPDPSCPLDRFFVHSVTRLE